MDSKQYGVWFGAGTIGSMIAMAIYGGVLSSAVTEPGYVSDGEQLLLNVLPWIAIVLTVVAVLALAGFMNAVLDHISESRHRR